MQTIEYKFADKSSWPRGQWDDEPDKVQWQDKETGLICLAVRNGLHGGWCGYVGVVEEHPWFKQDYHAHEDVEVHGGLTFSDFCVEENKEHGICHVPDEDEPDNVWWFGFDCAHYYDMSPRDYSSSPLGMLNAISSMFDSDVSNIKRGEYRTLAYVQSEVARLARQIKAAA